MFMVVQGWDWSEGSRVRAEAVNDVLAPNERASRLPYQPAQIWGRRGRRRGGLGRRQPSNIKNGGRFFITVHP